MSTAKWICAITSTILVLAALGVGLWFGGGPTTRDGWEAAAWAAGIATVLALPVNVFVWAVSHTSPPSGTSSQEDKRISNTVSGEIFGGTVIQASNLDDVRVENPAYGGDHIDLGGAQGETVIGKAVYHHYPLHRVDWPIRIGAIPEQVAHYQHRAIADQLDNALSSFGTVVLHQVLSGTGGVGKTQIAAHHARALARITDPGTKVDVLVWANATSREQITFAYAQAARQLFATTPDDPAQAAELFLAWLNDPNKHHDRRWFIVWDGLADPTRAKDLWPPHDQPRGRMLVTTRRRDHSLTTQGRLLLEVDVYTPAEAHTFLSTSCTEANIPHAEEDLNALAKELGFLPLALGQAVPYMAELGMDCTTYLALVRDRKRTLVEVFPDWDSPTPLAATWDLSLTQADTFAPQGVARPLMGLIALLDRAGIPEEVLTSPPVLDYLISHRTEGTVSTTTSVVLSAHQIRVTLVGLHRWNLITRTVPPTGDGTTQPGDALLGAHQLVQRATREHTKTRPNRHSVRAVADALLQVWPDIEHDTALAERLRNNTAVLRGHHEVEGRSSERWLWEPDGHAILFRAGSSLGEAGRVSEAVAYWQEMVEAAHQHLGSDHSDTLAARSNLATWRGRSGDVTGAATAFGELLADTRRVLGPDHPRTLINRHNLARWQGEAGDPIGAAAAFAELLNDRTRILGPDDPHTLATRNDLARWRGEAGDPAGATAAYQKLLTDQLRVLGPDHPYTFTTRNDLAHMLGQAGDPAKAAATYQKLLTDQLRVLGPDHPSTLTTRNNLAGWWGRAGDAAKATAAYQEILKDQLRVLGPDHPSTLNTRSNLARCTYDSGYRDEAIVLLQVLIPDQQRVLGVNHPDTRISERVLAQWSDEATKE
ncbi:tetratricopeptide (TPR) repeat protein [Nocardiopsis arvandica]|uniref:Tetratricopeptide (TPR) repeat protein n=1 Tax=Nocardiopsis sinuspersici TaxID=501010 RepID=A0A7Y9XAP2_9ACTN|nr:tetratricopeptide repeat protein [Nocardiopsis sinuspersici]NYH51310.1 tetratricopeptide (TPR) repeat protein [Nocardiopsis sinuspersici]